MAENTEISWADHTMNFWLGCTELSPACDHCYARVLVQDRFKQADWGNHPRKRTAPTNWNMMKRWNKFSHRNFKRYGRHARVFCSSLSDFFDNQVDPQWRADAWDLIRECDGLIIMFLTKRPQNVNKFLPVFWSDIEHRCWIGVTIENQDEMDKRRNSICKIEASTVYLSCEPLLGSIDLNGCPDQVKLIISGGESGPNARPWHPEWRDELQDWCLAKRLAFHWKQNGEWREWRKADGIERPQIWIDEIGNTDDDVRTDGTYRRMVRVGKREAGCLIRGEVIQEMPDEAFIELKKQSTAAA